MNNDDLCPMSDLPPEQCALPCHRNEHLPSGVDPAEEPVRGVAPVGVAVWPLLKDTDRLHQVASATHVDRLGARSTILLPQTRHRRPRNTGNCRWVPDLDTWCTPEHTRDCRSNLCKGCKPCHEGHCGHRGSCPNHVDTASGLKTCPQCIGTVRAQIAEIVDDTTLLAAEHEHAGTDSEAANLAGPAAAPEQVLGRLTVDDARGWCAYPRHSDVYDGRRTSTGEWRDNLDAHHPFAVLGRWEFHLRQAAAATDPKTFTTITTAAAYITGLLKTRMPHDPDIFDPLSRDISSCLTWVQDVLSDSRRPETGVPCPKCADAIAAAGATGHARALVKNHDNGDRTGANDVWVCPDVPDHRWREADYRIRVAGDYLTHADRLTADQLRKHYGIPPSTLRTWTERGHVRRRGTDGQGHLMYDVGDARRRNDDTRGWCDWPRLTDIYPIDRERATA